MGSITSWNRLEPQSNDPALGALAARVADPLWMMARQWQFREWQGEDTGSPVEVRLRYTANPVTRYLPGPVQQGMTGRLIDGEQPWETMVEAEPVGELFDRRLAALAGQRFLDALGPHLAGRYGAAYVEEYRLTALSADERAAADERAQRTAALLAGRALDGVALYAALEPAVAAGRLPVSPAIDDGDVAAVTEAATVWLDWWRRRFAGPVDDAWRPDRLHHTFAVAAPSSAGETVLVAPDHRGGRLDWTAFDVAVGVSLGADADPQAKEEELAVLPTGLTFPGMPAPRWWQFEYRKVDFGGIEAAPEDLGRLLLTEFALVYGNDFFGLPLPVPAGTICRVTALEVSTTFGETVRIPSAAAVDGPNPRRWRMFQLATGTPDDDRGAGLLMVPAGAVDVLTSESIEDVLFSRDEMANLGWAAERRVTGPMGSVTERREVYHRGVPDTAPPAGRPTFAYELATPLPPYWFPLVPTAPTPGRVRLEMRGLNQPLGRILGGVGGMFALAGEELPRSGRLVTRHHRRTRWTDGSTHVWTARRVRSGRGESSAGLRFDDVKPE